MPPHTTYLRITPQSVLQLRIFTDHPLDAGTRWLLHPSDPALPKIIQAIRHLILPKLREENLRKYGGKTAGVSGPGRGVRGKKRVKDVIVTDDFEVSLFLTELSNRHSLLVKQTLFKDKGKRKLTGNSTRLTGGLDANANGGDSIVIREESPSSSPAFESMNDIPLEPSRSMGGAGADNEPEIIEDDQSDADSDGEHQDGSEPIDEKKKPDFKTTYDGFSIWGWVLVLIVTRKDDKAKARTTATTPTESMMGLKDTSSAKGKGPGLMEEWISTQAAGEEAMDDDMDGD